MHISCFLNPGLYGGMRTSHPSTMSQALSHIQPLHFAKTKIAKGNILTSQHEDPLSVPWLINLETSGLRQRSLQIAALNRTNHDSPALQHPLYPPRTSNHDGLHDQNWSFHSSLSDLSSLLGSKFWTRLLGSWKHISRSRYVLIRKLVEIKVWFLYLKESSKEWWYMCVSCRILHDPVVFDTCYWWTHVPSVWGGCARRRVYVRGSLVIGLVWVPIQVLLRTRWYLSTL